jgi:hypothetical protein
MVFLLVSIAQQQQGGGGGLSCLSVVEGCLQPVQPGKLLHQAVAVAPPQGPYTVNNLTDIE